MTFPVGNHSLHPDVSMNFQMNRWFSCVGEREMLEEMRTIAPRISIYANWKREFVAPAKSAAETGQATGTKPLQVHWPPLGVRVLTHSTAERQCAAGPPNEEISVRRSLVRLRAGTH